MQQIFIELTLRAEQDEYASEGIEWTAIPFFNNRVVCELLDGARPPGLFRILDDTCKTLHGAREAIMVDKKFIETATQVHGSQKHFSQSMHKVFTVKHYAGDVTYAAGMFGESNKDALNKDLVAAIKQSGDKLVQFLYPEEIDNDDKKAPPTAGNRIRTQCQSLVTALMQCSPHYVRCIKSNDIKKALHINPDRVKHQTKYLGLVENIKVRRAGFAYRAEYHRFLERFSILSPATYPDWRGSDKDGCKQILKTIAQENRLPVLSSKGEVQLGKSKIFVRQPETYFELERLRELQLGLFVVRIQKVWRQYHSSKGYVMMQRSMARLFAEQKKARRSDSIYRPYQGDYLDALADSGDIRDSIFQVIDTFSDQENIVFADPRCGQLVASADAPKWQLLPRIVVLTTEALYLFTQHSLSSNDSHRKSMPRVLLRRRVPLQEGQGLESITVSKFADPCVGLAVRSIPTQPQGDKSRWVPDDRSTTCSITGQPFSMFNRRHHCRACGKVCSKDACTYRAPVPDLSWNSPERICDNCIGYFSVDPLEDLLLVCARRSEFICILRTQYDIANTKSSEKKGSSGGLNKQSPTTSTLPLHFASSFRMRMCGAPSLATRPADEVSFCETNVRPRKQAASSGRGAGRTTALETNLLEESGISSVELVGSRLTLTSFAGLPHELVSYGHVYLQSF